MSEILQNHRFFIKPFLIVRSKHIDDRCVSSSASCWDHKLLQAKSHHSSLTVKTLVHVYDNGGITLHKAIILV